MTAVTPSSAHRRTPATHHYVFIVEGQQVRCGSKGAWAPWPATSACPAGQASRLSGRLSRALLSAPCRSRRSGHRWGPDVHPLARAVGLADARWAGLAVAAELEAISVESHGDMLGEGYVCSKGQ